MTNRPPFLALPDAADLPPLPAFARSPDALPALVARIDARTRVSDAAPLAMRASLRAVRERALLMVTNRMRRGPSPRGDDANTAFDSAVESHVEAMARMQAVHDLAPIAARPKVVEMLELQTRMLLHLAIMSTVTRDE